MTREEIMSLTERELEIAVGREVMWYSPVYYKDSAHECWILARQNSRPASYPNLPMRMNEASALIDTPRYTEDANALRDMEEEIDRRHLGSEYVQQLTQIKYEAIYNRAEFCENRDSFYESGPEDIFALITAPLEMKCRAALIAATEKPQ